MDMGCELTLFLSILLVHVLFWAVYVEFRETEPRKAVRLAVIAFYASLLLPIAVLTLFEREYVDMRQLVICNLASVSLGIIPMAVFSYSDSKPRK